MRRHPWDPAVVITQSDVTTLLRSQFPHLSDIEPLYVGAGWDNTAWRVDDVLFRFPRRPVARALLHTEISLLGAIAPHLTLPITAPCHVGQPTDAYPYPWAGYRWLHGETGCTADYDPVRTAVALARFLKTLHALPHHAPLDGWRSNLPGQAARLHRALDTLDNHVIDDVSAVRALADELEHTRLYDGRTVLCHGDLYARHVLIQDRVPVGIIDWGDVHRGDPATDLACAWLLFDDDIRDTFWDAYGRLDDATHDRARFRALFSGVFQAKYAHAVGDDALLRAGRAGIRRALEGVAAPV